MNSNRNDTIRHYFTSAYFELYIKCACLKQMKFKLDQEIELMKQVGADKVREKESENITCKDNKKKTIAEFKNLQLLFKDYKNV